MFPLHTLIMERANNNYCIEVSKYMGSRSVLSNYDGFIKTTGIVKEQEDTREERVSNRQTDDKESMFGHRK